MGQIGQLDVAADAAGGSKQTDQRAQAATVDVVYVPKVDDDVLRGFELFLDGLAQQGRLFAKDDAAMAVHDGDAVNQARVQLQSHSTPPATPSGANVARPAKECKGERVASRPFQMASFPGW